jgi:hypothetical protein
LSFRVEPWSVSSTLLINHAHEQDRKIACDQHAGTRIGRNQRDEEHLHNHRANDLSYTTPRRPRDYRLQTATANTPARSK